MDNAVTEVSQSVETNNDIPPPPDEKHGLMRVFSDYFKKAGVMVGVWGWGYFHMSSAWLLLGLFFYCGNERYRSLKDRKRKFICKAAREDEKKAILSSVDELPSWVYFPDVERCEWINKIIKQMWPYIGEYFKDLLETTVLTSVQENLPSALKSLKFGKIQLGDIPPRIGGVKVYIDNVKRNEIYMDIEINDLPIDSYASDCQIKMAVKGMNLGIKDLMLHGTLRVILKPLVNKIPIIGGYTFFFLNRPNIDFDLTGVTNLLDLPVISNTLRSLILDQISNYMVPPNKLSFPMVEGISANELSHPIPEGVMVLNIVACKSLKAADFNLLFKGKSDPYCRVLVGAEKFKTKVIQNSCNPHFDEKFEIVIDQKLGQYAEIMVFDEDPGEDDELGMLSLDIQDVEANGFVDSWFPLENVNTGVIHIKAVFLYLSKDKEDLDQYLRKMKVNRMSCALNEASSLIAMVTIDSASNLKRIKKMMEPSPFAKVSIGQKSFETKTCLTTTNPLFEETFQFLLSNINLNDLEIEVLDRTKGKPLGTTSISLKEAFSSKDMTCTRPYQLSGGDPNSQIIVQVTLRILTENKPKGWAKDTLFKAVDFVLNEAEADNNNTKEKKVEIPDDNKEKSPQVVKLTPAQSIKRKEGKTKEDKTKEDKTKEDKTKEDKTKEDKTKEVNKTDDMFNNLKESDSMVNSCDDISLSLNKEETADGIDSIRRRLVNSDIESIRDLLACDSDGVSDPYVRLYLLPDRSNHSKRKTHTIKDNLNPVFDEKVEWHIAQEEISTKTLEVGVKNAVSMFSKSRTHIGKVFINLQTLDLNQASTLWYDLSNGENIKSE